MDDYIEICGGRENCSSEITHACGCGIPVVFLCTDCVVSHLKEPFTHNFIPLDQAQLSYRSMNFNSKFRNDLSKYALLKSSIQQYVTTLHSYKEHLKISKIEVLTYINQEF